MNKTIAAVPSAEEAAELYAAIDKVLGKIDKLRVKMRRDDAVIEESSRATRVMLADLADLLAELKAA